MRRLHFSLLRFAVVSLAALAGLPAQSQQLTPDIREKIDKLVTETLTKTGTPGASLVVVKDGQIAYLRAYGSARLDPQTTAKPEMRFCIGSLSKPITAEAILFLQEQGKLSLDDKVSRFLPDLYRANEVTIRQVLSQTSGYQEYWTVDYLPLKVLQPIAPSKILEQAATRPLNFDPGMKWEISDTNYVIAGMIVEKASGMSLYHFLREKLFVPLSMESVVDIDSEKLGPADTAGYMRYALGPPRPAPREGQGWLFGGEELAMTAQDMGKWDISLMNHELLKPFSYRQFEAAVSLSNGLATNYALGNGITRKAERRAIYGLGDVSGFSAANTIFPDDHIAIAILTNMDAGAPPEITSGIVSLLFPKKPEPDPAAPQKLEQARKIFDSLQHGTLDRSLFTEDANNYFKEQALQDFSSSLTPLGNPQEFVPTEYSVANGLTFRDYRIKFANLTLVAHTIEESKGKIEQYSLEQE
ncbi:MAG TPA: serine hydrolase domain-containing protein [Candidatus Angelobacter sp.]